MDWPTIKEGLRQWFATQAGIPVEAVHWAGEPAGMGAPVEAEIDLVGTKGFGLDELVDAPAGGGLYNVTAKGHRAITVQFRVEARAGDPGTQALTYCDRARDRARLPSADAMLAASGLGINSLLNCAPLPSRAVAMRNQTRAVLEMRFNAITSTDDTQQKTTIATVDIGGTATTAGGDAFVVPEQPYPVEPTP